MEERVIFKELLSEFKEMAAARGGTVTRQEVETFFAHASLDENQIDLICDYLNSQMIRVEGYAKSAAATDEEAREDLTEESGTDLPRSESLQHYLEEIEDILLPEKDELKALFDAASEGSKEAGEELVRLYLPKVCSMAGEYEQESVMPEDLIQEGNIGLMLAVAGMERQENLAAYQALLFNRVSAHMEEVIRRDSMVSDGSRGMLGKVAHLHEAIRNLTQELEHSVSIDELSAYLEIPREEIIDILNLTGSDEDLGLAGEAEKKPWEI